MNVHIPPLKNIGMEFQFSRMTLEILHGQHGRLFHHIAQVPRDGQGALALAQAALHIENLPAGSRPRQAGHHPRKIIPLIGFLIVFSYTKIFPDVLHRNLHMVCFPEGDLLGHPAYDPGNLLVEFPHPRLTRVVLNDMLQHLFGYPELTWPHTVVLQLLGHQMATGNLHLFLHQVAAYFNEFQPVAQRRGNGAQGVGRSDEHHLAQIVFQLHIVVVKFTILLRIKDLQQCRRRITVELFGDLVDFIEHEHRVRGFGLPDILDDPPGHRPDVGFAVPPDLRLIMEPAQAHPHVLATQGTGHRLAQGGLPHPGRTIQTENGRLQILLQLQHRQMLQYTLLHLFKPEMVLIKHPAGILQIKIVGSRFVPRKVEQCLTIAVLYRILPGRRVEPAQLLNLLLKIAACLFAPFFPGSPLPEHLNLLVDRTASQLVLDGLHLLMQHELPLLPVYIGLHFLLDIVLQLQHLHLPDQITDGLHPPVTECIDLEKLLFLFYTDVGIGTDEIDQEGGVLYILDGKGGLGGYVGGKVGDLDRQILK